MSSTVDIEIGGNMYSITVTPKEMGVTNKGGSQQKNQQQEGGKKGKKEKKAKSTRKLSPYMKFAQKARQEVLAEHPELKSDVIAVGRKIGEKWRALSDSEKASY